MKLTFVHKENGKRNYDIGNDKICPILQGGEEFIRCLGNNCPLFIQSDEYDYGTCSLAVIAAKLDDLKDDI